MAMIILFFSFPSAKEMPRIGKPLRLKQLDYLGAILNAIASVSFVLCLQEVGTKEFSWKSGLKYQPLDAFGCCSGTILRLAMVYK